MDIGHFSSRPMLSPHARVCGAPYQASYGVEFPVRLQGAQRRWFGLGSKAQLRGAGLVTSAVMSPSVPAAQLRRVRAALAEQAALTVSASRGLAAMETWVKAWQPNAF